MTAWVCGACGGENPEGMRFCGHCGAARQAVHEPDVADALRSFVAEQVADHLIATGGKLPEERRLITALFADVSGFTALADRLDPEQLLEVIDPVISGLSSIVGRYEGYVEKFAGDALLALFGAPVTHEDDAERALRVALEMHAELDRLCRELPHDAELTLHVGINSGHGIARILGSEARMDYAVLGDSVILAQRLESAAPPGESYVSEMTVRLAENHFEFEPVGELTLKGKSEPVPAWRLLGPRHATAARTGVSTKLVGRERELAAVAEAVGRLRFGTGAVVAITGEPGIGKSRLTDAARAHAESEPGLRWFEGRCVSYGAGLAYWPYLELLRRYAGLHIDDAPDDAVHRLGQSLAEIEAAEGLPFFAHLLGLPLPAGSAVASLEPEAFRRELHRAFAAWVQAAARAGSLVIAIEDVHWADASTVALTAELARLCMHERLLLFLIARPEGDEVIGQIAAEPTVLSLEPLEEAGVTTLLEGMLGSAPPAELASFVIERTAGNPFFAEEVVRSLRETDALERSDGRWTMRAGWDARTLPETVEEVLSARIDLLPRPAATLLQTASVIGRRVPLRLLEGVATDVADVPTAIDELVASAFLERVDAGGEPLLSFHHALVQDTAYARILRRRQRDLHRKVAEVAEGLYGAGENAIDLLARHLYLGEAGAKALEYLVRAGERAQGLFANEEALLHLQRAAEVAAADASMPARLPEIQLRIADLQELIGAYDDAASLYATVRDATHDVRAWAGIASTLRKQGKYSEALAAIDDAFSHEELKGVDTTPLWLEQGWTLSVSGRFSQAVDVLEAGLAAAPSRSSPTAAALLLQLARAETIEGKLDDALAHGLEAVKVLEREADLRGLATALRIVGNIHTRAERLDEAAATLRRGLELAERVGNAEEIGGCLINLGLVELERGLTREAIELDRRAIMEFERIGHGSGRAQAYTNLAHKLAQTGDYDGALVWGEKALELAQAIGHSLTVADVTDTIALVRLRTGAHSEAAAKAEEAAQLYLEMGAAPQAADSFGRAAEAWEKAGDGERAERARELAASTSLS